MGNTLTTFYKDLRLEHPRPVSYRRQYQKHQLSQYEYQKQHGSQPCRGGAGNIGPDSTQYVDGEIVREGVVGEHGDGAFSTGRGGAANIGSPGMKATKRKDDVAIPDVALRPSMEDQTFHTGRGGGGNIHKPDPPAGPKHPIGFADKLKNKLFKKKAADKEPVTETTA